MLPRNDTSNWSSVNEMIENETFSRFKVPILDISKTKNNSCLTDRNRKADTTEYYRCAKKVTEKVSRPFPCQSGPASWVNSQNSINNSNISNSNVFSKKRHSDGSGALYAYSQSKMSKSNVRVRNRSIKECLIEYYPKDTAAPKIYKPSRVSSQENIKELSLNILEEMTNLNISQSKFQNLKNSSIPCLNLDKCWAPSVSSPSSCTSKHFGFKC